jgi:hypothetical protein
MRMGKNMKLYDNGEPILKTRMEDEDWYGYFQNLIEISNAPEFTFITIDDPSRLVDLFNQKWAGFKDLEHYRESFPSDEQILRWSVLLTERHNNAYNRPEIIRSYRDSYAELEVILAHWTDWDMVMLELAVIEKRTGNKEFFKDVKKGGLPKNKFWIYDNENPLANHLKHLINGLVTFGILEEHEEEVQWRWVEKE